MNEPSIGVSVGGVAPVTRALNPGGSMRHGNAGVAGREVESAMNESVGTLPTVVSGATRDG